MDNLTPSRGYFSGPEGKVNRNAWITVGLCVAVFMFLMGGRVGEFVLEAVNNSIDTAEGMIHLAFLGGILFLIMAALMDPKKRCWYLFRAVVRYLTSKCINLDPIGIRKSYVERVQAKYEKFTEAVSTLRGQLISAQRKAATNAQELTQQTQLFHVATQHGDQRQQVLLSKAIQRKEALKSQYDNSIASLSKMQKFVVRYQEICADTITDLQDDIKTREEQMALTKATRGITGGIRAILQGLPERDMYEEAGNVIDSQYDQTLGEFDNALDMTKGILTGADLSDDAALQAALAKFENSNTAVVVGKTTKAELMRQIAMPTFTPTSTTSSDYSDLLK